MNYGLNRAGTFLFDEEHDLKKYDWSVQGPVPEGLRREFADNYKGEHDLRGTPDHDRSVGDEVGRRLCVGLQNYDGDVQSDSVAQGFGLASA